MEQNPYKVSKSFNNFSIKFKAKSLFKFLAIGVLFLAGT